MRLMGIFNRPNRGDLMFYALRMILMIAVGIIGLIMHVEQNLTSEGLMIQKRFVRGAQFLAPMLYANMGA